VSNFLLLQNVRNFLDTDGDLSRVVRNGKVFASDFTQTASGSVSSMKLGNGNWESTQFNSRLQPTQIALGNSPNATNLLKLNFDYGGTDNDGNLKSQTIAVPTVGINQGFTAIQTYNYDSLNRLKDAKEMIGTNQTWKQTYKFDKYGNRNFDTVNNNTTTLAGTLPKVVNPEALTSNNQLKADQDGDNIVDYLYDASGNLTKDAQNNRFGFNAENRQKEYFKPTNSTSNADAIYSYDGDGKRIKKELKNGTIVVEIVIFVYDANSRMVAEYSTNPTLQSEAQTSYMTNDTLGSPRIITNQNGQVTSRRDFMPYGEDLYTAERTPQLGYKNDNVKERFTGYARDQESGLEYAQARMYSASLGRFTGCDPVYVSKEHTVNPQRWNLYVYVVNNPLVLTDPDGRKPPKRIIDVYIIFNKDDRSPKNDEAWKNLQKTTKKADIRVHYVAEENAGEKIMKSLNTKGRSVVIVGHSNGPAGGIVIGARTDYVSEGRQTKDKTFQTLTSAGLSTFQGTTDSADNFQDVRRKRDGSFDVEIKPLAQINAKNLFVFTCQPGSGFSTLLNSSLSSTNRAAYFNSPDGSGGTRITTLLNVGLAVTQSIANGDSTSTTVNLANGMLANDPAGNNSRLQDVRQENFVEIRMDEPTNSTKPIIGPKP
jgi:RHS repeat-associated protein